MLKLFKNKKDKEVERKIDEFIKYKNFKESDLIKQILLNYYKDNIREAYILGKQLKNYDFLKDVIDEYILYTSKTNEKNERIEDYEYTNR